MSHSAAAARCAHAHAAFLWACRLDVEVQKPGNVSFASAGHGMRAAQFVISAEAAAGPLTAFATPVGERIEKAVVATRAVAGCNTNLGIVLLCAPLAAAWERVTDDDPAALASALAGVLASLDVDDARAAFRAIALASPAGLGTVEQQDVARPPSLDLRAAMALAADRDSIACEYANGYSVILSRARALLDPERWGGSVEEVVQRLYLGLLAAAPDSHIVRKLGAASAHTVTEEAAECLRALAQPDPAALRERLAAWDESLKRRGINPGTSADLCVASLFAAALLDPALLALGPGESWHGTCIGSLRAEGQPACGLAAPFGGPARIT